ncbi:hypothetical protein J5N97_011080 [Dioscorea zingiberensis]|uniref:Uncharacterized protein n=1 Tax=Dioscorea zingiberensis TaxID=325984 RepID=A0A9D5D2D5_9LILI|nr:hypothetical protein J5N97_011080 [Dioscorea zingiberensis]
MPAPMASLKSSMGSKGSNLLFDEPAYLCSSDERAIALRSAWINRLNLRLSLNRPLAPPRQPYSSAVAPPQHSSWTTTGSGLGCKRTISTDESRTTASIPDVNSTFVRRFFNIFPRHSRPPPPPPPRPPMMEDRPPGGECRVTGFGPFQVRTWETFPPSMEVPRPGDHAQNIGFPFFRVGAAAEGGHEKLKLKSMAAEEDRDSNRSILLPRSGRLSSSFQFRGPPPVVHTAIDKGKRILNPDHASSYNHGRMRSVCIENGRPPVPLPNLLPSDSVISVDEQRPLVDPWRASTSGQRPARIEGGIHHGTSDHTAQCCPYVEQNTHVLQHSPLQLHLKRQNLAALREPEEPFSYWNMGKFNRTTVSSVLPPTAFAGNLGRKRLSNTDNFVPSKCRKLHIKN